MHFGEYLCDNWPTKLAHFAILNADVEQARFHGGGANRALAPQECHYPHKALRGFGGAKLWQIKP